MAVALAGVAIGLSGGSDDVDAPAGDLATGRKADHHRCCRTGHRHHPRAEPQAVAGETDARPATAAAPRPTTTAPRAAAAPDRTRPAGMTYSPEAAWPETLSELDRLQAAVDQGQQPWRNSPADVARAYLLDRGLPAPGIGAFQASAADAGSVSYTVAGMGGQVDLRRLLNGSIWYVAGSRSATLPGVQVERQSGSLSVVLQGGAEGTVTARAKRPGGAWAAEESRQLFAGGTRSITLGSGDLPGDLILELRVEGADSGLAEIFLGPGTTAVKYSALDTESRLQVDGLGPVRVGMAIEEATAASGLAMKYIEGGACSGYRTDGSPAGVAFISVGPATGST